MRTTETETNETVPTRSHAEQDNTVFAICLDFSVRFAEQNTWNYLPLATYVCLYCNACAFSFACLGRHATLRLRRAACESNRFFRYLLFPKYFHPLHLEFILIFIAFLFVSEKEKAPKNRHNLLRPHIT